VEGRGEERRREERRGRGEERKRRREEERIEAVAGCSERRLKENVIKIS
jgi:hypothetical protein